jgi:DNA-binding SARP family transcriptional activator/predicted ATPase
MAQALPTAPVWRVRLLGPLRFSGDLGVVDRFPTRKAASLVGYLAYRPDRLHSRERLADLLWPDAPGDLARLSLRTALWSVRRRIEPADQAAGAVLEADRDCVGLRRGAVETDVGAFWSALRSASEGRAPGEIHWLERAASLYGGELLEGLDDEWVEPERERLGSACSGALLRGAELLESSGAIEEALQWALRAVKRDPLSEEGHVAVVRLHLAAGRRVEATRHAREVGRIWRDELGCEASAAVTGLLRATPSELRPTRRASAVARRVDPPIPCPLTPILGRERELERIVSYLRPAGGPSARLVTITGVGGCGKTRLALAAAHALADAYGGAVALAPLDGARTASDLIQAIGSSARSGAAPGVQPLDAVIERLENWRPDEEGGVLLVLDGWDDPADDALEALSERLLGRLPSLACLVTSRRTLGVLGEHTLRLAPLPVPSELDPIEEVRDCAAVRMMFDRLRMRRPALTLDDPTARLLARLAAVVDGLPLGIELLSGWADLMDPGQMLTRLGDPLQLAARPGHAMPERHASLDRVFEWSWNTLDAGPRQALVSLASLSGSWTLDAAEAVCGNGAMDALRELVDRSLVIGAGPPGTERYRMLTPVRAFVRQRAPRADLEAACRAGTAYYVRMAREAGERLGGPDGEAVATTLAAELDGVMPALEACLGDDAAEDLRYEGVRAAAAIWPLWERLGRFGEGRDLLLRAVARSARRGCTAHAHALLGLGMLSGAMGDYDYSRAQLERCVTAMRACGDREGEAAALVGLASRAWDLADIASAARLFEAAHNLSGPAPSVQSAIGLAKIAAHEDRFDDARALQGRALDRARASADRRQVADVLQEIGVTEWFAGQSGRARPHLIESLATYRRLGDRYSQLRSLWCLGNVALSAGQTETARAYFLDATEIAVRGGHPVRIAYCLEGSAGVAVAMGMPRRAARVYGAALRLRERIGYGLRLPAEIRLRDALVQAMCEALGSETYETELCEGRALTRSEAVQYAVESDAASN